MIKIVYLGSDPSLKGIRLSISDDYKDHDYVSASAIPIIRDSLGGVPYDINGDVFNTISRGEHLHLIHWKVVMDVY